MRKNWFIAIGLWAGLVLLGWSMWPSRIERTLEASAREVLRSHPSARFLKDVTVSFDGQEAVLSGKVHKAAMRGVAAQIVGEELRRGSGISGRFNPVTAVRNQIAVEPLPAGWLVMVLDGDRITLLGLAGSEDERDSVSQGAAKLLSKPGVDFRATVKANDETASASENADLTVNALPAQLRALGDRAAVLTARIGEEWQAHEPDAENALEELLDGHGVAPEQWDQEILPHVKQAQQRRAAQRHAEEQAARLAKLPPPHVILAIRGGDALVQGEVGTAALKSQIIEAALRACTGMQVFDQLRVSADRRPVVDAAAFLGFFPPAAGAAKAGLIAVAVPGGEWKTVTLPANDVAAAILETLPRDMAASLVEADAKNVARWFADTSPDPSAPIKPCVTLAVFSDRVWLRGQVAEESSRSQIIEAARNAYPDHVLVHFIRLNPRCLPVEEALPTARSFPAAPGKDSSGIIGFAIPGEAWKSAPVSDSVFTPEGIQKAGILPQGFPPLNAMDEFSEALEALKIHWDERKKTNSR